MKPRALDAHGVEHRPTCGMPGWTSTGTVAGITVNRCTECGAVYLTRDRNPNP